MKRTEVLQEIRKMRFEEAYEGWNAGRLTQTEAAQVLGMCERSFRRYLARYEAEGQEGLIDRRLEQVSNRRAPVDEVMARRWRYFTGRADWLTSRPIRIATLFGGSPLLFRRCPRHTQYLEQLVEVGFTDLPFQHAFDLGERARGFLGHLAPLGCELQQLYARVAGVVHELYKSLLFRHDGKPVYRLSRYG